ncbi:MAG: DUF4446 family protein [Terriglobia bacterium]
MQLPIPSFYLIAIVSALLVGALVWLLVLTTGVRRLRHAQTKVREAAAGGDVGAAITDALEQVGLLSDEVERLAAAHDRLGLDSRESLQRVGFIRFNAFDNLGGELSFAAALLNDRGDGLVISSICGSEESRTYAKLVHEGESEYRLSKEEQRAIAAAIKPNGSNNGGSKL